MNFGPLGKPGGHRRLNVAITRAQYNVKLVGSIFPTDINIEKTNSEGVRMLRSYIDFAINGASTLQNELKFRDTVELESPFEVSVYGFLTSKGYSVATQIGCSGYRIDMAVKHPKLSGVFILGIECDGATYHNSRTARERDRLRQTVLEDIGWKIYRIWSTDWIKDPITEGDKLIKTVEKTLANFSETELSVSFSNDRPHIPDDFVQTNFNQIEEVINEPLTDQEKYNFVEYIETDIEQLLRSTKSPYPILVVLRGVIENEYPIHFENLCKKVAPIYGFQKATQNVKNTILNVLDRDLKNEIVKNGEFISPKNSTDIPVRVPKLGSENIRPVNYISNEELAEAMLAIAKKSYGIRPEDLTVKTARIYGFNRTGTNITQAFRDAFDFLRNSERIKIVDGNKVIAV